MVSYTYYLEKLERIGNLPVRNNIHLYVYSLLEDKDYEEGKELYEELKEIVSKMTKKEKKLDHNVLSYKIEEHLETNKYNVSISSLQAYEIMDLLKEMFD